MRLYPYFTERMLHQSEALAPLGAIAAAHRERLDGSGYPRGVTGPAIPRPARILGAADAYQAMREPRPYRPALTSDQAATQLQAEVRAGRLERESVEAVLGAAGHRVSLRREGPAGLTAREIDVLRLLARGLSNREIGGQLTISPKTVANHVEHIYAKIDGVLAGEGEPVRDAARPTAGRAAARQGARLTFAPTFAARQRGKNGSNAS